MEQYSRWGKRGIHNYIEPDKSRRGGMRIEVTKMRPRILWALQQIAKM